jgi:hypothetical protein
MRYLNLAILATTALSQSVPESTDGGITRQLEGDFTWDIQPEDGFPIIGFDSITEETEVIFKYNFTGTLTARKALDVKLYQNDCVSASDTSITFTNTTSGDELGVDIAIIQKSIKNSVHYQAVNITTAILGFCLRVDYNYIDGNGLIESVNFHQENVTIHIDLTANFTLSGINVQSVDADNEAENAQLDYPVEAYICLDDNSEVESPATLTQGSVLQVCVRIDDTVVTEGFLVEDILTFVISQPDSEAIDYEPITAAAADPLTDKICHESGICNVKTQLMSRFFTDASPGDLRVDGVAILAFGKASLIPSSAPIVRRLRTPIRGFIKGDDVKTFMEVQQQQNMDKETANVSVFAESSQRILQDGAASLEFDLKVALQGISGDYSGSAPQSPGITIQQRNGFPIIGIDDTTIESYVVFKYDYTGALSERKYLEVNLYQNDCTSPSDESLVLNKVTSEDELDIDIDIIQETIAKSVHYQDINATAAIVRFCIRVDYKFIDNDGDIDTVNFHQERVAINVDLMTDFTLTNIDVELYSADNEGDISQLDFPVVEAYICLDDNSEVNNPTALTQGSPLQVCVKIDETVVAGDIIVEDILTFVISQPDGTATDWETITNTVADPLTYKICRESGICNIKSQLLYKFFTDTSPDDLRVDGVAILAIGKAPIISSSTLTVEGTTPAVRRLRAPIRGLITVEDVKAFVSTQQQQRSNGDDDKETAIVSFFADSAQRMLQDGPALSEFGLDVGLQGVDDGSSSQDDSSSDILLYAIVAVVGALIAGCFLFVFLYAKRRLGEAKE